MTDSNKDAVGILRGIKDRVEALEQAVSTSDGVPNLLRILSDGVSATDSTNAREQGALVRDATSGGDSTDARENDASAVDASTSGDSTAVATDDPGGWTWDQSRYDFDEWS